MGLYQSSLLRNFLTGMNLLNKYTENEMYKSMILVSDLCNYNTILKALYFEFTNNNATKPTEYKILKIRRNISLIGLSRVTDHLPKI